MVIEVLVNLIKFMILFLQFLFLYAVLIFYVMNNTFLGTIYEADDGGSGREPTFVHVLYNTFLISLGMGGNGETDFGLFLNITSCIVFIIILLNILIADVGETFDKVKEDQVLH